MKWPPFEQWTYLSPSPVYSHPLPPKPMLCFRPSSLSLSTNNIVSEVGGGGFTVIKQMYEIVDKSTRFRQVCQLLLSLIAGLTAQTL